MAKININKSPGPNGPFMKILKMFANSFAVPLASIYHELFRHKYFPEIWKQYKCFYALFVILHKINYLLSNKLFINVLSLSVLMPRPWSHFAPFFVTVTTEQINTTVILIYNNNHIYMQHLFFS